MADDINMTTILSPLTEAAKVRRVKATDPENQRRSTEEERRRRKKRKGSRKPRRESDAVEVDLQKTAPQEGARRTGLSEAPQKNTDAKPGVKDKAIDIRV
jgi:hypothetical protein